MYLIHEFHSLSWITEINELFHNILIYWDAPVCTESNSPAVSASVYGAHVGKVVSNLTWN